jgi:hypothetical protein
MKSLLTITSLCVLFASATVLAYPTQVFHTDGPQDPLFVPDNVHELGTSPVFDNYPDELIFAIDTPTNETVCFDPLTPDDLAVPNTLVEMRNLTGIAWAEVWYVADWDETTHSNYDGWVGDTPGGLMGTAFRIDDKINNPLDIHTPLVFESMTPDGIFEPLETWRFVIQDYANALGKPASALGSIGVPSAIFTGDPSSGSIIAVPVPEPMTIGLLGIGALGLLRKRKNQNK